MMNILLASDNNYVSPAMVLLQSLFENAGERITIYYLYDKISIRNINRLNKLVEKNNGVLHFLKVPGDAFARAPIFAHFTKETYFRFLAPTLLPKHMERILYLDPDIVVNHTDIKKFYYQSFENEGKECAFVACEDRGISHSSEVYQRLCIPNEMKYFNAGVLLMNLNLLRCIMNIDNIFNYISINKEKLTYCDQDVLNALFYDRVKYDAGKYNLLVCNISNKSHKKIQEATVIHYAGPHKPWKYKFTHLGEDIYIYYVIKAGCRSWYIKAKMKSFLVYLRKKI